MFHIFDTISTDQMLLRHLFLWYEHLHLLAANPMVHAQDRSYKPENRRSRCRITRR
jgi:hypothetical protein